MSSLAPGKTSRAPLFVAALFLFMIVLLLVMRSCSSEENAADRLNGALNQCKSDLALVVDRCYGGGYETHNK